MKYAFPIIIKLIIKNNLSIIKMIMDLLKSCKFSKKSRLIWEIVKKIRF